MDLYIWKTVIHKTLDFEDRDGYGDSDEQNRENFQNLDLRINTETHI